MASIIIPNQFKQYSTLTDCFETNEKSVNASLKHLINEHPMLKAYIFDEEYEIRGFVNLFLDGEMVEDLSKEVKDNSRIQIILAVAGG